MGRLCGHSIVFTGNVGDVCGQHWRDIHIIKTRPVYNYIRTKRQGVCRTRFSQAVALAHVAQAAMYPAPSFGNGYRSNWNGRISQAMLGLSNGVRGLAVVPIVILETIINCVDCIIVGCVELGGYIKEVTFQCSTSASSPMFDVGSWYSLTILKNSDILTPWCASVVYGQSAGGVPSCSLDILDTDNVLSPGCQFVLCTAHQYKIEDVPYYSGVRTWDLV